MTQLRLSIEQTGTIIRWFDKADNLVGSATTNRIGNTVFISGLVFRGDYKLTKKVFLDFCKYLLSDGAEYLLAYRRFGGLPKSTTIEDGPFEGWESVNLKNVVNSKFFPGYLLSSTGLDNIHFVNFETKINVE